MGGAGEFVREGMAGVGAGPELLPTGEEVGAGVRCGLFGCGLLVRRNALFELAAGCRGGTQACRGVISKSMTAWHANFTVLSCFQVLYSGAPRSTAPQYKAAPLALQQQQMPSGSGACCPSASPPLPLPPATPPHPISTHTLPTHPPARLP